MSRPDSQEGIPIPSCPDAQASNSKAGRDSYPILSCCSGKQLEGRKGFLSHPVLLFRQATRRQEGIPLPSLRGLAGAKLSHLVRCVEGCGKAADERLYCLLQLPSYAHVIPLSPRVCPSVPHLNAVRSLIPLYAEKGHTFVRATPGQVSHRLQATAQGRRHW
jgi:hypothetical protein